MLGLQGYAGALGLGVKVDLGLQGYAGALG